LAEIEREKEVVIEEINSYLDSPSDSVYDQFEDMIFAGSGLGHNILGTPESVRQLTSDSCRGFIERYYVPRNMAFYCADPSDHKKVERLCLKYFGFLKYEMPEHIRAVPPMVESFDTTINKDGHQAHTIVGMRTFTRNDPRRHALLLLNNYLGGPCMNSRLNQEMREKRGMVYTVDSSVALMCNSGLMQIYFGADPDSVERGKKLIRRELQRLAEAPIKPRLFQQVKQQYAGQLSVSSDHKESQAMALGKSLLYYGEIHDIEFTRRRIMELTAEELRAVAETLLQSGPCCLTLK
jgi:predicted Zn-dependent peptidase